MSQETTDMDLAGIAVELYALLPKDFTAARNERAKELGKTDKDLSKQVRGLPKPSTAAWLVNMLAAHRREEIDGVIGLGAAMREAQDELDPQQLRELSDQRHRLLAAIAKQGRKLAKELGHPVSETIAADVEQTLRAAMADPAAAAAVASGLLTDSLSSNGLDPVELDGKVAVPEAVGEVAPTAPKTKQKPVDELAQRRTERAARTDREKQRRAEEAERRRQKAQADVDKAARRLAEMEAGEQEAEAEVEQITAKREDLAAELAELKSRIRTLERSITAVDTEAAAAEDRLEESTRSAAEARRGLQRARKALDDLD
jgi:hypothetical protein